METSEEGIELIKEEEGFIAEPYLDPTGHDTIGYGTLISGVTVPQRITREEGDKLLRSHLDHKVEPVIESSVKVDLNQSQFDALASLIYNIGGGAFKDSSLLRAINSGASEKRIRELWRQWNRSNGQFLKGLDERRKREADLFFRPAFVGWVKRNSAFSFAAVLALVIAGIWYSRK